MTGLVVRFVPALVMVSGLALAAACSSDPEATPPDDTTPPLGGSDSGTSGSSGSSGKTDGGSSGGDTGTSGGGPFCPTQNPKPGVCEDFDDSNAPWKSGEANPTDGEKQVDQGGSVVLDTAIVKSAPNALKITSATKNGNFVNALYSVGSNDVTGQATKFTVGFAYRSENAPPKPNDGVFVIARAFLSESHQITIELSSQEGAVVREIGNNGNVDQTVKLGKLPTAKAWIRYDLVFDITGKKLVVNADGAKTAEMTLQANGFDLYAGNFGITTDLAQTTSYYDDLVLDLK